ncbi:MAG: putative Ig domain-containing protein, partial [Microbacteriaceae bacterium]|nr:putative Ig domain-containing protein [Burkholderiaceae bacterium]
QARLADGRALPTWLSFDTATQRFSGTPANADVASLLIRVTASDLAGASAVGDFSLTVANVNDAPTLVESIAAQSGRPGALFDFRLPATTFVDIDVGDILSYSATLADGSPLPTWLRFDNQSRSFSGTPSSVDVGILSLRILAVDRAGAQAEAFMAVVIGSLPTAPVVAPAPAAAAAVAPPDPVPEPAVEVATAVPATVAAERGGGTLTAAPPAVELAAGDRVFASYAGLNRDEIKAVSRAVVVEVPTAPRLNASRSDAVLAAPVVAQLGDISLSPMLQALNSDAWQRRLEELHRQMEQGGQQQQAMVASGIAVTGGLSIGYVVWLVRGGVLLSSMLSALPAWQILDPLPVLAAAKRGGPNGKNEPSDDDELEGLFDAGPAVARPTAAALASGGPATMQDTPDPMSRPEVDPR